MTDRRSQPRPLDHVVVAVPDLDASAGALEGAGFYVTARSDHPFGTSNRLVMLQDVYIELVSVTRPDLVPDAGFARFVLEALAAGRAGPILFAFRSEDAEADLARMRRHGLPVPAEPLRFGRQSARRDGTLHPVEFSVVIPDLGGTAVGSFVCHHHTADEVWHPGLLDHANGATRLAAVEVAEADDASWESMRKVAEADGPPFRLPNTTIGQGPARLVVAARETASAEIAGATVELVGS